MNREHRLVAIGLLFWWLSCAQAQEQLYPSFDIYSAPSIAHTIGQRAEASRERFAREWFGVDLPEFEPDCWVEVILTDGSGGRTSFEKTTGAATGFRMAIQGRGEELLSTLDHEVMHTVLHTIVPGNIPRWIDEGLASLVERQVEQDRLHRYLLSEGQYIPSRDLFDVMNYPGAQTGLLYAQGHSMMLFLQQHGGKQHLGDFIIDGVADGWEESLRAHYDYTMESLDEAWQDWLQNSRPYQTYTVGRLFQFLRGRWVACTTCVPQRPVTQYPRARGNPPSTSRPLIEDQPPDPVLTQSPPQVTLGPEGPKGDKGPKGDPGQDGRDGTDAVVDYERIIAAVVAEMPQFDLDAVTGQVIAKLPPIYFVTETQNGKSQPMAKRLGDTVTIRHYLVDIDEIAGKVAERLK